MKKKEELKIDDNLLEYKHTLQQLYKPYKTFYHPLKTKAKTDKHFLSRFLIKYRYLSLVLYVHNLNYQ